MIFFIIKFNKFIRNDFFAIDNPNIDVYNGEK